MLFIVIAFLVISLLFYVLFGGADFGAGIIEIFAGRRHYHTISKAIAPVWEANHIWLILVVVILFMGFPLIYADMSRYLHIPLLALLVGIVLRGCAFTFRHYDAIKDQSQDWYTFIFRLSSLFTPLFLGMVAGGMLVGRMPVAMHNGSFYSLFIAPWFNLFCLAVGIFTVCLFSFLAAVYLIGEARSEEETHTFVRAARNSNIALVLAGGAGVWHRSLGRLAAGKSFSKLYWYHCSTRAGNTLAAPAVGCPGAQACSCQQAVGRLSDPVGFRCLVLGRIPCCPALCRWQGTYPF